MQSAGAMGFANQLLYTRLHDGATTGIHGLDLGEVQVHTYDPIALVGQASSSDRSHVS